MVCFDRVRFFECVAVSAWTWRDAYVKTACLHFKHLRPPLALGGPTEFAGSLLLRNRTAPAPKEAGTRGKQRKVVYVILPA